MEEQGDCSEREPGGRELAGPDARSAQGLTDSKSPTSRVTYTLQRDPGQSSCPRQDVESRNQLSHVG